MKVITLNDELFEKRSLELGDLVVKSNWKPDLIIGIKTGGAYVSRYIKKMNFFSDCNYNEIVLQRKGTEVKNKFNIKGIFKFLPYSLLNIMRIVEARHLENNFNKDKIMHEKHYYRIICFPEDLKKQIKRSTKLLIVDDAVDSGKTMLNLKENIIKLNPNLEIRTAALTVTFEDPLITPEYNLNNRLLIRFPWSKDYKGNDKYEKKVYSS